MFEWTVLGVFVFFVLLAATGWRFPLPEEVTLLLAGVYAAVTGLFGAIVIACILGVLTADTLAYARGRSHSVQFARFKKGAKFITRTGFLAVVMSRFIIATRAVVQYMAGAMRMPRTRFHVASLLGAVVSVLLFVSLGRVVYLWLPSEASLIVVAVALVILTAYLVRAGAKAHLQLLENREE